MKNRLPIFLILLILINCQQNSDVKGNKNKDSQLRIISLVPSLTEILFELKMGKNLIGVSTYCTYPDSVNQIEKLGGLYDVSMEKIIRMQPDYIVMDQSRYMEKQLPKLKNISPEIISLKTETIADIYKNIEIFGKKFKKIKLAGQLVTSIKDSIDKYLSQKETNTKKKVLLIVGRVPGEMTQIYAAGKNTFITEITQKCGLENIVKQDGYIQVNSEYIYKSNLDYVLEINAGIPDDKIPSVKNEWKEFWKEKGVEVNIEVLNEDFMVIPGPRVYLGVKRIMESLD